MGNREMFKLKVAKKLLSAVTVQFMKQECVKYVVFHRDWS